ncbi:hypothetical protein PV416_21310 [Streptomyces ipomoeae]|uniref:Uncharacterized protein n=1 Tax=Streptomyces ipomoeae 91-03 TaxID=698759 RepID=L1KJA5_9ACTN|nr:hypothetical protein [Streptomyces ipomoeae]EKX60468.1 hypothetical protein STRIP9103_07437 [Streptomyces ipomoeae 91-03]MDX2695748.1 hypothetical protein [Streptomyces ipomoeae]MDX2823573.1 hypothetical protein [Streptomyces ipomoeae]MDX2841648.1 hypothetical protein [Streptomyces ipomoeae]MDX2876105.1 hypothetical protein [Streptomyces ipomoeae]
MVEEERAEQLVEPREGHGRLRLHAERRQDATAACGGFLPGGVEHRGLPDPRLAAQQQSTTGTLETAGEDIREDPQVKEAKGRWTGRTGGGQVGVHRWATSRERCGSLARGRGAVRSCRYAPA